MKALIVRLSSIGDVVHTLPAFAALRSAGHRLGWIVEPAARSLLQGLPGLEQVVDVPAAGAIRVRDLFATRRTLRSARYDIALDFQGLWKSAMWARASGAADVVGFAGAHRREPASAHVLRRTVSLPNEAVHVVDKNLALLQAIGIEAVGSREFPLPVDNDTARRVDERLRDLGLDPGAFAILNPGGGWRSKIWPAERFGALARIVRDRGLKCAVTWGPGDDALRDAVVAASDGAAVGAFPTTLLELAALARRARLVVAADTGPLHIACAVGTPVVALFGPTDPARNGPFDPSDVVVSRRPPCFPCYKRTCVTHGGVMNEIGVDEVAAAVQARLDRGPRV